MSSLDISTELRRDIDELFGLPMEINMTSIQQLSHLLTRAHATLLTMEKQLDDAHSALHYYQNKAKKEPVYSTEYYELCHALDTHRPATDLYHREQREDEFVKEHYYGLLEIQRRYFVKKLGVNDGKSYSDSTKS